VAVEPDYNLVDAFRVITCKLPNSINRDIIDEDSLKWFLLNFSPKKNYTTFTEEEISLVMKRLDKEKKGFVTFA